MNLIDKTDKEADLLIENLRQELYKLEKYEKEDDESIPYLRRIYSAKVLADSSYDKAFDEYFEATVKLTRDHPENADEASINFYKFVIGFFLRMKRNLDY